MTALGGAMQRNPWIMGGAVFMLLLMMVPGSLFLRNEWLRQQAGVHQRQPLPGLGYCSTDQVAPCVVSFGVDTDGQMIVTIRTDSSFPGFYLKIRHSRGENLYPCQQVKGIRDYVFCKGARLPVGEIFQFYLVSLQGERMLAQGNFSIIGLALGTPDIFSTPTPGALSPSVTATPTSTLPSGPGPVPVTPTGVTPTPPTPSYPNPTAYPNPQS